MAHHDILSSPDPFTHIAVHGGGWHQPSTWANAAVPDDRSIVHIPNDVGVVIARQEEASHRFIRVDGKLFMSASHETRLEVETLVVATGGLFRIGSEPAPVEVDKHAELLLISDGGPISQEWDPSELSRGLLSWGQIRVFGTPKTPMAPLPAGAAVSGATFDLGTAVPADWRPGDQLVVTSGHFRRDSDFEDETAHLESVSGTTITLDRALRHEHAPARHDLRLHVVNLTRNVVFRSASNATGQRAHTMFMSPDVRLFHTALVDCGRTDKTLPLDDVVVDTDSGGVTLPAPAEIHNRRGRYAVHFHRNPVDPMAPPPSHVLGCVVTGTPGWGFVNHSSHVDFRDNVCHDFAGAAFVTEAGDEIGNFVGNIAIRGTGNHQYRPNRLVFGNLERPQPLADFGFSGDGFWFQGPAIRARDNVASGCNGAGMIWLTTGAVKPSDNNYVGLPDDFVPAVYASRPDLDAPQLRHWSHDGSLVISDLPILLCEGLEAYGCLVGFHVRFNNHDNVVWYKEAPYSLHRNIVPVPGHGGDIAWADRVRQQIRNLTLWNNEMGLRIRYASLTDFTDVKIVNRQDYGYSEPAVGAEHIQAIEDIRYTDLEIDGYEIAGWIQRMDKHARDQVTFVSRDYKGYASFDTWFQCDLPDFVEALPGANSAEIRWTKNKRADRRVVRYREVGQAQWHQAEAGDNAATSLQLTGLDPGTTYEYQVVAGCGKVVSPWTPVRTFTTA